MGLFGKSEEEKIREQNAQLAENRKKVEAARRKHLQEQAAAAAKAAAAAAAAPAAAAHAASQAAAKSAPAPAAPAAETYTVASGDSLSKIAKKHLGDAKRWREIYDANRQLIGDNPDLIKPGQKLKLPAR
jgi:nucleoid-associated protein YgaU